LVGLLLEISSALLAEALRAVARFSGAAWVCNNESSAHKKAGHEEIHGLLDLHRLYQTVQETARVA